VKTAIRAAAAYSVATGDYTIEQLEAEACALCGEAFQPGQDLTPVFEGGDFDLYAHVDCGSVATR